MAPGRRVGLELMAGPRLALRAFADVAAPLPFEDLLEPRGGRALRAPSSPRQPASLQRAPGPLGVITCSSGTVRTCGIKFPEGSTAFPRVCPSPSPDATESRRDLLPVSFLEGLSPAPPPGSPDPPPTSLRSLRSLRAVQSGGLRASAELLFRSPVTPYILATPFILQRASVAGDSSRRLARDVGGSMSTR